MSLTGWLTMIVSIGGVLTAAAWAYYKVLSTPKETEHLGPEYFESMPEEERRRTAEALEKSLWQECARYGIDRLGFILPPSDG